MIMNIINKLGCLIFCFGVCLADSENLLIPISTVLVGIILFKISYKKIQ